MPILVILVCLVTAYYLLSQRANFIAEKQGLDYKEYCMITSYLYDHHPQKLKPGPEFSKDLAQRIFDQFPSVNVEWDNGNGPKSIDMNDLKDIVETGHRLIEERGMNALYESLNSQYQEAIKHLESRKWEKAEAILNKLVFAHGAGMKGFDGAEILYNYAELEIASKKDDYSVPDYLSKIPDSYSGPLHDQVLLRKEEIEAGSFWAQVRKAEEPKLQLKGWRWYRDSDYFVSAVGEVKNITDEPLENVLAVVSFYTKDGTFITSSEALIRYNPILPGQTSPFEVIENYNPAMEKASIEFAFLLGGTIRVKYP